MNLEKFIQTKDELKNKVLQEKRLEFLDSWYEDIKKKSNIVIYINPEKGQV